MSKKDTDQVLKIKKLKDCKTKCCKKFKKGEDKRCKKCPFYFFQKSK